METFQLLTSHWSRAVWAILARGTFRRPQRPQIRAEIRRDGHSPNVAAAVELLECRQLLSSVSHQAATTAQIIQALVFEQPPPASATAGTAFSPAVQVAEVDNHGTVVSSDNSSTITLSLTTGRFANGDKSLTAAVVAGVATFSGPGLDPIINKVGKYTLIASDSNFPGRIRAKLAITPALASQLIVDRGVPVSGTAGASLGVIRIAVRDAYGNVAANPTPVTLSLSTGMFSDGSTSVSSTTKNGVATFTGLKFDVAGTYTILTGSDAVTGPSFGLTINPARASKLAFVQQPTSQDPGTTIYPAVTVAVEDAFGNVTHDSSAVTLTLSSNTFANGSRTVTVNAINGVATFRNLIINSPNDNYTLQASDGALTTVTSAPFAIAVSSGTFIESGFNDVTGINSDGIADDSPFNTNNVALDGQGTGEPGWDGPWRVGTGNGVVENSTTYEGDGAAAFFGNTAAADRTLAVAPTAPWSVSFELLLPAAPTRDVIFRVYDNGIPYMATAIGAQWSVGDDLQLSVLDGNGDSADTGQANVVPTGMFLTTGVWHQVTTFINPVSGNWDVSLDGVMYNAPNGHLGYRGAPVNLNSIQFLNEIAAPDGSYIDDFIVHTSGDSAGTT